MIKFQKSSKKNSNLKKLKILQPKFCFLKLKMYYNRTNINKSNLWIINTTNLTNHKDYQEK